MPLDDDNALIGDWFSASAGNANQPPGGDLRSQGDDQIRRLKGTVRRHFPGFTGTAASPKYVNASEDEINKLVGLEPGDPLITLPVGTPLLFYQNTAPPGFAIIASLDEHSVRITQGTGPEGDPGAQPGGVAGGANDFGEQFADHPEGATYGVADHTLTANESGLRAHTHPEHGHRVLQSWQPFGPDTFGIVELGGDPSSLPTPTYIDAATTNPSHPYIERTVTPSNNALNAAVAHAHGLNLDVKWAACIVAAKT